MTKELVWGFDFEDISEVELACRNNDCKGKLSVPPGTWCELPSKCPYCDTAWGELVETHKLLQAMTRIQSYKNAPVRLRFKMVREKGSGK